MHPIIVNSKNGQDHKDKYLHFIKNARLKSVRSFEWYFPITARPYHFDVGL